MSHLPTETVMDAETLEALRGSIAKWKGIVAGTVEDMGPDNCPLCIKFYDYDCFGCPVYERTGDSRCGKSPYDDYSKAEQNQDYDQMEVHAKEELEFLISLLPPGEKP